MHQSKYTCGNFIDLQKAFDTVDHSILLNKQQYYVIRGIVKDRFSSYLLNRIQTTQIGNDKSEKNILLTQVCPKDQFWVHYCFLFILTIYIL